MKKLFYLAIAAVALLIVACGGDDATSTPTATTAAPTSTPTTAPPTATATPTATTVPGAPTSTPTATAPPSPTPAFGDVPAFTPAGTVVAAFINFGPEILEPGREPENAYSFYAGEMMEWFVNINNNGAVVKELGALEDWQLSADGKKWTFTLRKGMVWHDGEPVTSDDALFSMERYGAPDAVCTGCTSVQNNVESVVAIDNYVWEMNFIQPDQFFPTVAMAPLQGDIPILPRHHWDKVGGTAGFEEDPLGAGPMKYVDRRIGEFVEFEAFDDYWNKWRIPGFKILRKLAVPEATSRLALVETGDADLALLGPQNIDDITNAGLRIMGPRDQWVTYISFAQAWDPAFASNDINVRKAITLALDREALAEIAYPGDGGSPYDQLHTPAQEGFLENVDPYPFDPTEARRIIQENNLEGLEIVMPQYDFGVEPALPVLQEAAAAMLAGVGFSPKLVPLDFASLIDNIQQGKIDGPVQLQPYLWSTTATFDSNLRILFVDREDGGNIQAFPDLEGLGTRFFDMLGTLDRDARLVVSVEASQWMHDIYGYIPIAIKNEIWAVGPRVGEWLPARGVPIYKMMQTLKPVGDSRIGLDPF